MDARLADDGLLHPWRIVAANMDKPSLRSQRLMRLPSDRKYLAIPRDPIRGDLTALPLGSEDAFRALAADLLAMGARRTWMAERHRGEPTWAALAWNGIAPEVVDTTAIEIITDAWGIGGDAGREIAAIVAMEEKTRCVSSG